MPIHSSVPHLRVSHIFKCPTQSGVPHNHAYSFGVLCPQLSHIIVPIHPVSHTSKRLAESRLFIQCLACPSACLFGATCPIVSHNHAYSFGISCIPRIQVPHTFGRLT